MTFWHCSFQRFGWHSRSLLHDLPHDLSVIISLPHFGVSFRLLPSGKQPHNYGKSPFLMGKLTISMAIFNSYVKLPEGNIACTIFVWRACVCEGCCSLYPQFRNKTPHLFHSVSYFLKSKMSQRSISIHHYFYRCSNGSYMFLSILLITLAIPQTWCENIQMLPLDLWKKVVSIPLKFQI